MRCYELVWLTMSNLSGTGMANLAREKHNIALERDHSQLRRLSCAVNRTRHIYQNDHWSRMIAPDWSGWLSHGRIKWQSVVCQQPRSLPFQMAESKYQAIKGKTGTTTFSPFSVRFLPFPNSSPISKTLCLLSSSKLKFWSPPFLSLVLPTCRAPFQN